MLVVVLVRKGATKLKSPRKQRKQLHPGESFGRPGIDHGATTRPCARVAVVAVVPAVVASA